MTVLGTFSYFRLNEILLRSHHFERPTQISTDFKKTGTLGQAVQKIDYGGSMYEVSGETVSTNYVKIAVSQISTDIEKINWLLSQAVQ